jgi:hypothetical protein
MANVKISALPAATSVAAADVLPIVQSATTKKATFTDVAGAVGGVRVYASAAARNSAIASPTEGMCVYLTDEDTLQIYTGSAWVAVGATKSVSGVSDGLVYITSSTFSGTTSFNNVFSSSFSNYKIVVSDLTFVGSATLAMRLRAGGTDQGTASSDYFTAYLGYYVTGSTNNTTINGGSYWFFPSASTGASTNFGVPSSMDIYNPQAATRTHAHVQGHGYDGNYYWRGGMATYNATTSCDGFTLYSTSANAISGKVEVYGYRKA